MSVVNFPQELTKSGTTSSATWSSSTNNSMWSMGSRRTVTGGGKLFVAVGKVFKESQSLVASALANSQGREIWIIHVHVPAQTIHVHAIGVDFPISRLDKQAVKRHHEKEKNMMLTHLEKCALFCSKTQEAKVVYIEADSVVSGILTLISEYKIETLVMGADADGRLSWLKPMKTVEPTSEKADQVSLQAPGFCHIYIVKKGRRIDIRHGMKVENPGDGIEHSNTSNSASIDVVQSGLTDDEVQSGLTDDDRCSTSRRSFDLEESMPERENEPDLTALPDADYVKGKHEKQTEKGCASYQAVELRKQHSGADSARSSVPKFYAEFTLSEIAHATGNFNQSKKIGQGGFGSVYLGFLRCTTVAVKIPDRDHMLMAQDFQQEASQHCDVNSALIYEYLPNGSLEDRLNCRDNTPPLSWRERIQIAIQLCSALVFLHSNKPQIIVHGDLKPGNILLDAMLSCKLSDFGICRMLSSGELSAEAATRFHLTTPKGTSGYIDPLFYINGELTAKSDIYAYGIILLRLLTGQNALGIRDKVKNAVDINRLDALLDPSAGDWPFAKAKQLTLLALRCCELRRSDRPDHMTDLWEVIGPMRVGF